MSTEQTTTPDPAPAEETPKLRIEYGMLVEEVDCCTCGAGGEYGHEPGCGLDPWMPVSELVAELAELARVRPVVDAAREFVASDAGMRADLAAWRGLRDVLAALDGDAAATPQPAGESVSELTKRLADLLDVAVETEDWSLVEDVQGALHAAHGAAWAVSSAPPVDVTARIRAAAHAAFTAMDKGVLMSETGDGAESVLAVGHLHLIAEYLERHPDWPSAQAIVRALATPTTEETTDAR